MPWDLSCLDWEDRLRAGRAPITDLPLYTDQAERAVSVFNLLRLADVPGNPRLRDAAGDWFRDIVRALFGSLNAATGERLIREVLTLVPKKNSKTSYGALLMLTALILNMRPKARFIMTAPTQDITELAYSQIEGAILLDPVLEKRFHNRGHIKTIVDRKNKSTLEIMSFDPSVLTGQKPAGILVDEVHAVAKMAKAASAIRQLRGGMLAIPESFLFFITTQSEEPPAGVFRAELMKARAIRDGRQKGAMLPVLYEFPEAMQRDQDAWRDPKNWAMVTPNAGRSVTIARLHEEFTTAETTGADELRAWASQHLNVEVGVALHVDRWLGADFWPQSADQTLDSLETLIQRCEVICIGIDGGGLDDLFGLAAVGRCKKTGAWLHWGRAWAHPIVLERNKKEAARLKDLEEEGDLTFVREIGDDLAEVLDIVARVFSANLLGGVGLDPVGIGAIVQGLRDRKIPDDLIVGIGQGFRLNGAIKTAERKLAEGTFRHGGQALMAWSVGNARTEQKGNAMLITKQASGSAKIDPLMALFDAVELMARNPKPRGISVYEKRGLVSL